MADSNERIPRNPNKRYKTFLDPNYREHWVSPKTHSSWISRAIEANCMPAVDLNTAEVNQDGFESGVDYASRYVPSPDHSGSASSMDTSHTLRDSNSFIEAVSDDDCDTDHQADDSEDDGTYEHPEDEERPNNAEQQPSDDDSVMFESSALSVADVMQMITAYCVRFCLSHQARQDLVQMIRCLAGPMYEDWTMTKYKFQDKYDPPAELTSYTFFCTLCEVPLLGPITKKDFRKTAVTCTECQSAQHLTMQSSNRFVNVDLKYQFGALLNNRKLRESLIDNLRVRDGALNEEEPTTIRDVYDGQLYKTTMKECSQTNSIILTYNFNTDGMPIFNSSKKSSWPLLVILNELPPHLRFKHVILCGLWVGDKEPTPAMMNTLMQQFVTQANKLTIEGITLKTADVPDDAIFKLVPLCCSVNSVARPIVQNRLQYNGYHGCSWCYARGNHVRGAVRYLFNEVDADLRTHETHKRGVEVAADIGKSVNGVKGDSISLQLLLFDMVWGFPLEYMHAILLGVIKLLWDIWTTHGSPVHLTVSQRNEINVRLLRMTPIYEIQRLPRPLSEKSKWKASEWLSWLLFYSLPCLHSIMADAVFDHLSLLVRSTFTLLQNEISVEELNECEINLTKFVADFEILYGEEYVTFNIHSLLHLVKSVKMSGPLWGSSEFSFESTNYHLKKKVNGPKAVDHQISGRYLHRNLLQWKRAGENSQNADIVTKSFNILFERQGSANHTRTTENAILLGKGRVKNDDEAVYYDRCIFAGTPFHTTGYKPDERKNDSIVRLVTNEVVQINAFVILDGRCYADVQKIDIDEAFRVTHILQERNVDDSVRRISVMELKEKVLILKVDEATYICKTPRIVLD